MADPLTAPKCGNQHCQLCAVLLADSLRAGRPIGRPQSPQIAGQPHQRNQLGLQLLCCRHLFQHDCHACVCGDGTLCIRSQLAITTEEVLTCCDSSYLRLPIRLVDLAPFSCSQAKWPTRDGVDPAAVALPADLSRTHTCWRNSCQCHPGEQVGSATGECVPPP